MKNNSQGILYVVATPIGNLDDITFRAVKVLSSVDEIVAEDTRHSKPLLQHYHITTKVSALHDFNERDRSMQLIQKLSLGQSVALISDAGTPLISDPGFYLVRAARAAGIQVVPIPGASAVMAAISVSSLPVDRFVFDGFLPEKQEAKQQYLKSVLQQDRTVVCYEAPHRFLATLRLMCTVLGESHLIGVARELTKHYESILMDTTANILLHFESHPEEVRGEFVLLIAGVPQSDRETVSLSPAAVLDCLLKDLPLKQAVSLTSELTGFRKNALYAIAVAKK